MNNPVFNQLPPEDQRISDALQSKAQSIRINPQFESILEARLKQAHRAIEPPAPKFKILPALGWAILAIGAFLVLNWAVRSLAPAPQPAANGTPNRDVPFESTLAAETSAAPEPPIESEATPTSNGTEYDWRGIKLYLNALLPSQPAEANLYQLSPEQPATLESVRVLAQRFGVDGEIYLAPGELPDTTNYLVTDGKQRLYVRSDRYFTYYADYPNYSIGMFSYKEPLEDKAQELY